MRATVGTRITGSPWQPEGAWHNSPIPDRTSVRHAWAKQIEGTNHDHDTQQHPYTNWGYTNRLDWVLADWRQDWLLAHPDMEARQC